jgi:hypothetical protein
VTRDEHMQATRVTWAKLRYGPAYSLVPGGWTRWFCGPNARRKAVRDRLRAIDARPFRTLTSREVQERRRRRVPTTLREVNRRMLEQLEARAASAPVAEQLSLLGGEP